MRAWDIALFCFIFSFAGVWLNETGIFYGVRMYSPLKVDEWTTENFNRTYVNTISPQDLDVSSTDLISTILGGGWFLLKAIVLFFKLLTSAITFPLTLSNPPFSLPTTIVMIISAICYISYAVAIVEFISARRVGA